MFHYFISSSPTMLCFFVVYTLFLVVTLIENVRLLPTLSSSKPITVCHTHHHRPSQPITAWVAWATYTVTHHTPTCFTMAAVSLQQFHTHHHVSYPIIFLCLTTPHATISTHHPITATQLPH